MHRVLMVSASLLGLAAGPVLAQTAAPGSSVSAPAAGGGTEGHGGMTGLRPMRGQAHEAVGSHRVAPGITRASVPGRGRHTAPASVAQDNGVDVPRSGDYRGGVGSPSSNAASNIGPGDTRGQIAPRLPNPDAGGNTPQAYLAAAQRALAANRTGAAQEALERAETRLLSRSTDPSQAGTPDPSAAVQAVGAARRALATRDTAGARSAISSAMSGLGS